MFGYSKDEWRKVMQEFTLSLNMYKSLPTEWDSIFGPPAELRQEKAQSPSSNSQQGGTSG